MRLGAGGRSVAAIPRSAAIPSRQFVDPLNNREDRTRRDRENCAAAALAAALRRGRPRANRVAPRPNETRRTNWRASHRKRAKARSPTRRLRDRYRSDAPTAASEGLHATGRATAAARSCRVGPLRLTASRDSQELRCAPLRVQVHQAQTTRSAQITTPRRQASAATELPRAAIAASAAIANAFGETAHRLAVAMPAAKAAAIHSTGSFMAVAASERLSPCEMSGGKDRRDEHRKFRSHLRAAPRDRAQA